MSISEAINNGIKQVGGVPAATILASIGFGVIGSMGGSVVSSIFTSFSPAAMFVACALIPAIAGGTAPVGGVTGGGKGWVSSAVL